MNWFLGLVCLGATLSATSVENVTSSESLSFPQLDDIESVFKSTFEKASYNELFDERRLRLKGNDEKDDDEKPQDILSYRQHGFHPGNAAAWKLKCVGKAMTSVARQLPWILTSDNETSARVSKMCSTFAWEKCGVDFEELDCDPKQEYRTISGTCNNLINTRWGSADQPFERFISPDYEDDISEFRVSTKGQKLPNPRKISRALSKSKQGPQPEVSLMLMQWGQFLDHDLTLTPEVELEEEEDGSQAVKCCVDGLLDNSDPDPDKNDECRPIDVKGDPFYVQDERQCIRFMRSMRTSRGCEPSPMEQININTAFVDGSMVYGSDKNTTNFVRSWKKGMLSTTTHAGTGKPLPPRGGEATNFSCPQAESMDVCFIAGDVRVDEIPGLTALHTTFIRLHNIIAKELCKLNFKWCKDDEKLYQETRRIVIALIQQITYRDWLPHVIGPTLMEENQLDLETQGYRDMYDESVDPTIRNVFATAAFRFGHSLIAGKVKAKKMENDLKVPGNFFNIDVIKSNATSPSSLLKGLTRCPSAPIDAIVEPAFTNSLFADEPEDDGNFYGLDLVSLNIQRGRDHGIPGYTKWRRFCGLKDAKTFNKLKNIMNNDLVKKFKIIYHDVDDIDLFPAGLSEKSIADGILGPTFSCIIARQFALMKRGDRFWYERKDQPKPFTPDQLSSIRSQGLVSILCRVSEHASLTFQPDPFLVATPSHQGNAVMDCSSYNFINLYPWKEYY